MSSCSHVPGRTSRSFFALLPEESAGHPNDRFVQQWRMVTHRRKIPSTCRRFFRIGMSPRSGARSELRHRKGLFHSATTCSPRIRREQPGSRQPRGTHSVLPQRGQLLRCSLSSSHLLPFQSKSARLLCVHSAPQSELELLRRWRSGWGWLLVHPATMPAPVCSLFARQCMLGRHHQQCMRWCSLSCQADTWRCLHDCSLEAEAVGVTAVATTSGGPTSYEIEWQTNTFSIVNG